MNLTGNALERILNTYSRLVERRVRTAMHMTPRQYAHIAGTICNHSPCALLIFGCGDDSILWHELNHEGRTTFLEDVPIWAQKIRCVEMDVVDVRYESKLNVWMNAVRTPAGMTEALLEHPWQIVLVDAPLGVGAAPGREQSVYAASVMREQCGSVVFVHDYERAWEKACCDKYLAGPSAVVDSNLAVWQ